MEKDLIYIGFSKARGSLPIVSWAIRLIEQTPYSHVYLRLPSPWIGRNFYFQASSVMVNFMGDQEFSKRAQIVEELPIKITPETKKKLWQYAIDRAGRAYSIKQLIGLAAVRAAALFGHKIKNPFADGRGLFVCVELIADVLEENFGIDIREDLDSIGLKEIYPYVKEVSEKSFN